MHNAHFQHIPNIGIILASIYSLMHLRYKSLLCFVVVCIQYVDQYVQVVGLVKI